jgi:membrane-bound lytic murein transglycosylase B
MGRLFCALLSAMLLCSVAAVAKEKHPGERAFIREAVKEFGLERKRVREILDAANYQQSIIDAITRPAEAKPWSAYRPIFMTEARIAGGKKFRDENRALLERIHAEIGVPPEYVTSIVGVETNYGAIMGNYKVIDALVTLAFYYPKRAPFFRSELKHLLKLEHDEKLAIAELKGSYAGAMGLGQFMPSSYRAYAVDFDGDGRRDLWNSREDALASVANYFKAHGWVRDGTVAIEASKADGSADRESSPIEPPTTTLQTWRERGFSPALNLADPTVALSLIALDGASGREYWFGFKNFYVITRYNRSPLYALAVHQLAQAIAQP